MLRLNLRVKLNLGWAGLLGWDAGWAAGLACWAGLLGWSAVSLFLVLLLLIFHPNLQLRLNLRFKLNLGCCAGMLGWAAGWAAWASWLTGWAGWAGWAGLPGPWALAWAWMNEQMNE